MTHKKFALNLAEKAGKIIRANFTLGMSRVIKKDGSPVTKTDLAINKLVIQAVKKNFPGHAVIGEEGGHKILNAQYAWLCDPVDGTIPFSHGMPTCAFSLALVKDGRPILGVGFDPFMDRICVAELGKGAFINGKKISVSSCKKLEGAYVSHCVWSRMQYPMKGFIDDLVFNHRAQFFQMGSIVYDGMLLAVGEIEGIIFPHHTAHDIAAIKIFVEEAGGKVTDLWGKEQRYDRPLKGAVISNGYIHKKLLGLVQNYLK